MVNDPIGDMIIQIKNAGLAGIRSIEMPYSKMKYAVADILYKEGYVSRVEKKGEGPAYKLAISIKYQDKKSAIIDVKRISKPGLRWYVNKHMIPTVVGGLGIAILSTPQGIMTGKDAKKHGIGGELLCKVW